MVRINFKKDLDCCCLSLLKLMRLRMHLMNIGGIARMVTNMKGPKYPKAR